MFIDLLVTVCFGLLKQGLGMTLLVPFFLRAFLCRMEQFADIKGAGVKTSTLRYSNKKLVYNLTLAFMQSRVK